MADNSTNAVTEKIAANLAALERWKLSSTDTEDFPNTGGANNNYILFPREYYSGCDITISFGNIVLDNIVDIRYQMQQQTQPIYGYGSHTFDAVMTGNRMITGSFKINFKETFYIQSVLDKIISDNSTEYVPLTNAIVDNTKTLNEMIKEVKDADTASLLEMAQAYEKRLWPTTTSRIDKTHQTMLLNPFGGYDHFSKEGYRSNYNRLLKSGFDIIISFGEVLSEVTVDPARTVNGTVKVLNGVFITGYGTLYLPTGEPLFEEYTFIAKDMDNTISL